MMAPCLPLSGILFLTTNRASNIDPAAPCHGESKPPTKPWVPHQVNISWLDGALHRAQRDAQHGSGRVSGARRCQQELEIQSFGQRQSLNWLFEPLSRFMMFHVFFVPLIRFQNHV